MRGNENVIGRLNELLGLELGAVFQYVAHEKICANWGYGRLASRFRDISLEEMKDAEQIIERILFLEGTPSMVPPSVSVGATVPDQVRAALETERRALVILHEGIATALEENDQATREFFAGRLLEEEGHVDWLETQLSLIATLGEATYLAQQLRS